MHKVLMVSCPESRDAQVVELSEQGEVEWCSRTVGKPGCDASCLPARRNRTEGDKPAPDQS